MRTSLADIERRLKKFPGLALLKWMNKETPLLFLFLIWGLFIAIGVAAWFLVPNLESFNIVLSLMALFAACILSIVVVL